jgi:hypothetical protein
VHPAVAAALQAAHVQPLKSAAVPLAAKQQHKLKVEAELENAEHMRALAQAAAKKVRRLTVCHAAAQLLRRLLTWRSPSIRKRVSPCISSLAAASFLTICGSETMTSDADKALKAKNTELSKSLRAKAHTLWLQERQALDEVSKDRQMVKQEEAAVAHVASEAATLAARMDKRLAAVNAEVRACSGHFLTQLVLTAVCSSTMRSKRRSSRNRK